MYLIAQSLQGAKLDISDCFLARSDMDSKELIEDIRIFPIGLSGCI
jgi:hypothetical protein